MRDGEKGGGGRGMEVGEEGSYTYKMGSDESHSNISLTVKDKVTHKKRPQTTTFEEKGEPKRIRTEVPLLTSLTPYREGKPGHQECSLATLWQLSK